MFGKTKIVPIAILISVIMATAPLMFFAQGQVQSPPAEKMVTLAKKAAQQVQNLIDLLDADDGALDQIDGVGLTENYKANVSLYETDGLENLAAAQAALTDFEYQTAADRAVDALTIFREVYRSINVIMKDGDLQRDELIENQGLLEAVTRELQRINWLREILPDDAPDNIVGLLNEAEELFNTAKEDLLSGRVDKARSEFMEAKEMITEFYHYLKAEAEESNEWRLSGYCAGLQERIRERFRYGQEQEIDFAGVLQSYGYQSEAQFMSSLQNSAQTALSEQNFGDALQDCIVLGQMVQQMEQALNQEISRHQHGSGGGSGGSDTGIGSGGSGFGSGGSGYGGP